MRFPHLRLGTSLAVLLALIALPRTSAAQSSDIALFGASGGAPPNILLLLDTSGSMRKGPDGCKPPAAGCIMKKDIATDAIKVLVQAVNPPDGLGGFVDNARFGLGMYTKDGGRLLVPVGTGTTQPIIDWMVAKDLMWALGGNSHGLAVTDMGRYFAYPGSWGPLPPWGSSDPVNFPNEDPAALPSTPVFDLTCRQTFLVEVTDGIWKGPQGGTRFGECPVGSGNTCYDQFIGDADGDGEAWLDDISLVLKATDFSPVLPGVQNVTTHLIGFAADDPRFQDVASQGGGTFTLANNSEELIQALQQVTLTIFDSLASFAAVAVPSSRTKFGASFYNAFFEPDPSQSIWSGHLESYRLAPDGEIQDASGSPAIDSATGLLVEPHNPHWDAGALLLASGSRALYTTKAGLRTAFDDVNVTEADLGLTAAPAAPPPPPASCTPGPPSGDPGYTLTLTPDNVAPGGQVTLNYTVPVGRKNAKKDWMGIFLVTDSNTDGIGMFKKKKGKTSGSKTLAVGLTEGAYEVRYLPDDGIIDVARSNSICASSSGVVIPPVVGEFSAYPNFPASGVDTMPELKTAIIDFVHGKDSFDQDGDLSLVDTRDVVLGDIFHSTPLVVGPPSTQFSMEPGFATFSSTYEQRDKRVYVGVNDGMLHAFDAGSFHMGDDPSTPETEDGYYDPGTGAEVFGYVPGLLLGQLKMMPRNNPRTTYFVDGSPIAADAWLGDGTGSDITKSANEWATVLITGFRNGGPGYLALDVTDPSASVPGPHGPYPKYLWEFTHPKLGDAWSAPIVARIKMREGLGTGDQCGHDDGDGDCREQWVAIFGGGYDPTGDPNHLAYVSDPASPAWKAESKALFVVALDTGQVLATVEFDASGASGPAEMVYSLPSAPAVLDLDFDGFADVVYIGDLGGQVWKWDIHTVGEDTNLDGLVDGWPAGVFFRSDPADMGGGTLPGSIPAAHPRSFYFPPAASFNRSKLTLAFGSGERESLHYAGDPMRDENNRYYVVQDLVPTGSGAFSTPITELDLTDVTNFETDTDPSDSGFFFKVEDGEKFVTDTTIFAGHVIVASFSPTPGVDECTTSGGQAFLYVFKLDNAFGFFSDPMLPPSEERRIVLGGGLPSDPRVSMAPDPDDDRVYIKTSTGQVLILSPPPRQGDAQSIVYWRQQF